MISAGLQCKWSPYRGAEPDCFAGRWGAGDVPSVMSSTSPLSPKHLAGSVLLQEQAESGATTQAVAGYLGKRGGHRSHRSVSGATYCVNFHVVGLPSAASTMIPGPGRWAQAKAIRSEYNGRCSSADSRGRAGGGVTAGW